MFRCVFFFLKAEDGIRDVAVTGVQTCALPIFSERYLTLLHESGAQALPHSGRTLLDHLVGTYRILRDWGNAEPICAGGLFHSIYGTNVFRRQAIKPWERDRVRAVIGAEAEQYAHLFCSVNRPQALL